ncbi:hypothetical protein J6590_056258 [Homalodisca vitripennis]|nr:hypothetical protein J6590_056258 [Homalodisca vitripennis]
MRRCARGGNRQSNGKRGTGGWRVTVDLGPKLEQGDYLSTADHTLGRAAAQSLVGSVLQQLHGHSSPYGRWMLSSNSYQISLICGLNNDGMLVTNWMTASIARTGF